MFVFAIFWLLMLNRFFVRTAEPVPRSENLNDTRSQKIQISDGKDSQWIEQEDIFCVEAAGNYICFHTPQGQLISRSSLKQIEEALDKTRFMRVSRSNIVNVNKIASSRRVNRSRVELVLCNDHSVTIGPTYWREIKTRLDL